MPSRNPNHPGYYLLRLLSSRPEVAVDKSYKPVNPAWAIRVKLAWALVAPVSAVINKGRSSFLFISSNPKS